MEQPVYRKKSPNISIQLIIVGGLIAVALIFFKYASAVYKDYQVELEITELKDRIAYLDKDNKRLEKLISHLDTDAYKEVIAKSELNLKRPGEIAIAIKQEEGLEEANKKPEEIQDKVFTNIPIYQKWIKVFFHPN